MCVIADFLFPLIVAAATFPLKLELPLPYPVEAVQEEVTAVKFYTVVDDTSRKMVRGSFRRVLTIVFGSFTLYFVYTVYYLRESQRELRQELDESRRRYKKGEEPLWNVRTDEEFDGDGDGNATNRSTTIQPITSRSPTNRLSAEQGTNALLSVNSAPQPKASWDPPAARGESRNVTVLIWTTFYGNKDLFDHIKVDSPVPDWCHVTFDRDYLNDSNALVFSMLGNDFSLSDLPPRHSSQPWIFFVIEPPGYHKLELAEVGGLFNRTMSYRLDSDYPCPYGYVDKRDKPLAENPYYADPNFPRNKTNLIAWMVSHCETSSNRGMVVQYMKGAGLSIDVYGACGTFSCPNSAKDNEATCYRTLGKSYKFYLAFENSICRDYITEKFSNALTSDMVPIVYGGGDYDAILPPYPKPAYINILDYESPKVFAQYLLYLDRNDTAYAEYFEWKQYYRITIRQGYSGVRKICYEFQKPSEVRRKVYEDLDLWWTKDGDCKYDWPVHWK